MNYPIWTLSGRFCGKVISNQVYNQDGYHVGYINGERIYCVRTGRVIGEFYRRDRVGIRTSKVYPIRGTRGIRGSRGFGKKGNKGTINPAGWEDPKF